MPNKKKKKLKNGHAASAVRRKRALKPAPSARALPKKKEHIHRGDTCDCVFCGSGSAFGFAKPIADDAGENLFIPPSYTCGAMHGDLVTVRRILPDEHGFGKGNEAIVEQITERRCRDIVGVFQILGDVPCVIPDEKRIGQAIEILASAAELHEGDKVRLAVTVYPDEYSRALYPRAKRRARRASSAICAAGEVTVNYGAAEEKGANYGAILDMSGIPCEFSEDALLEARRVAAEPISAEGRLDLRDKIIFTIDGAGAKDLDDAISVEYSEGGYLLGVHIADVSHYVKVGGAIDRDAAERGTSVYFTDKVIPMLPELLSNGCCSLSPDGDKYALSALIEIDSDGETVSTEFAKSIIRSSVRGVYGEVNDILEKGDSSAFAEKYAAVLPSLRIAEELYRILERRGRNRGALELDGREAEIILDSDGLPTDIVPRTRGIAERIIEQFMLKANVAAASFLKGADRSGVYRIHEEPSPDKLKAFAYLAHSMGLSVNGICRIDGDSVIPHKSITPAMLSKILDEAKEKGIGQVISDVLLRSLMKARYSSVPSPHFGLAEELYCHFTSPIRRYPDLFVHRAVSSALIGGRDIRGAAEAASLSTETELRAVEAERAIERLYLALYMSKHIGEEFDALITSVTPFGLFAETEDLCEGMIPCSSIAENTEFNSLLLTLTAHYPNTARVFRLGDKIRIRVVSVCISNGKVEYALA